jgi:hypothetical protein
MERTDYYDQTGRAQDLKESTRIDRQILKILFTNNIKFRSINYMKQVDILDDMMEYVKNESRFS